MKLACGTLAGVVLLGCARREAPVPAADAGAAESTVATERAAQSVVAPSGSGRGADGIDASAACDGLSLPFGENERIVWAARGTLQKRADAFVVVLDEPIWFTSTSHGRKRSKDVLVACEPCSNEERVAFENTLSTLVGTRLRANGILHARWYADGGARDGDTPVRIDVTPASTMRVVDGGLAPLR